MSKPDQTFGAEELKALTEPGWLLYSPINPAFRPIVALFLVASLSHLWLADAAQADWYLANALYLLGLITLCWPRRLGNPAGWLLCAAGLAIPLFFHRDQLTQSMILLFMALSAAATLGYQGWRRGQRLAASWEARAPAARADAPDDSPRLTGEWICLRVCQGVTVSTYLLAVLHKLNHTFFEPAYSCATYGVQGLFDYWRLDLSLLPAGWESWAPWWVLTAEACIALLYLFNRRWLAWPLALAFHIPLTLVMAPAFAFVMLVGHAAFIRPDDLRRLRQASARWRLPIILSASAATGVSRTLHRAESDWTMLPREWLLWALLLLVFAALFSTQSSTRRYEAAPDHQSTRPALLARFIPAAVVGLFVLNGLTPYLGLQYQHAGAMVSGLRIDRGCWNSLVFPESLRLREDYIRVDEAYLREPGHVESYERLLREQLWSPPQLRQMRRNWCREDLRPIYLTGTYRAREFEIADLCDDSPLPFQDDGVFGRELFPNYLRFQKNLSRRCPQTCIH